LAVRSENVLRKNKKIQTVSWLLDEGASNHFSLTPYELSFYVNSFPHGPFAQINDPDVIKLFELLVSHGADVNSCGEDTCALWMSAHFDKLDHVKFLIAHGAKLDTIEKHSGNSALSEAIDNSSVQIAEVLLYAGARISHQPYKDDVIHACWQYNNSSHSDASLAMLNFLKNAKIHITEKNLKFYTDQNLLDKPVYECARQFLVG
jgi:ankyrin repeat protein